MTPEELEIFDMLGEVFNKFSKEPPLHPNEQSEFAYHIHMLQCIVLARETYSKYLNSVKGDKGM